MAKRHRLFFDILLTSIPTTGKAIRLRATEGAASTGAGANVSNADRYGNFLESLPALSSQSPVNTLVSREVTLSFQPVIDGERGAKPARSTRFDFRFASASGSTSLPFLNGVAASSTGSASLRGNSAVFTRDFSVLLKAFAVGTTTAQVTVRGVLVVERAHSMDV